MCCVENLGGMRAHLAASLLPVLLQCLLCGHPGGVRRLRGSAPKSWCLSSNSGSSFLHSSAKSSQMWVLAARCCVTPGSQQLFLCSSAGVAHPSWGFSSPGHRGHCGLSPYRRGALGSGKEKMEHLHQVNPSFHCQEDV